jgi:hypothetical protein
MVEELSKNTVAAIRERLKAAGFAGKIDKVKK